MGSHRVVRYPSASPSAAEIYNRPIQLSYHIHELRFLCLCSYPMNWINKEWSLFADGDTETGREVKGLFKGCPVGGGAWIMVPPHRFLVDLGENHTSSSVGHVQCQGPKCDRGGRKHTGGVGRAMRNRQGRVAKPSGDLTLLLWTSDGPVVHNAECNQGCSLSE